MRADAAKPASRYRRARARNPAAKRALVEYALRYAAGEGEALFQPWATSAGPGRGVRAHEDRAGEPDDLRRTFANWCVAAGVPLFPIALAMGHNDTRMLERVYGRQSPDQLAVAFHAHLGSLRTVAPVQQNRRKAADPADQMDPLEWIPP